MKNLSLFPTLASMLLPIAMGAPVAIDSWSETGRVENNFFSGNGTSGFTETFDGGFTLPDSSVAYDSGAIATFASDVTLDEVVNTLEFSFTVENIIATGAGEDAVFRVGFENDEAPATDATVHYVFGYGPPGDRLDAGFAGQSNSANEYARGSSFDGVELLGATPLTTGNSVNITVRLIYLGDAGGGAYDYRAEIDWDGQTHGSSSFTRNTNTWDKVYVNTNSVAVNVPGDTYTVSNAQVETTTVAVVGLIDVDLAPWSETGADSDNIFTGNGTSGFSEQYGADTDGRVDSGAQASFLNDVTLDPSLNVLEFSLRVENLVTTVGLTNTFRVGFENGDAGTDFDATVHYIFGWGDPGNRRDGRFAGVSGSSNEFARGTPFDLEFSMSGATPLFTGNTSDIRVRLIYLSDLGNGDHEYQAEIVWDGVVHRSTTFTRNTNTWDGVYVLTNESVINVPGDGFTISNAQVRTSGTPPPATDYDDWGGALGFDLAGGPNDDDDGDGLSNFEEYAFGLDPTAGTDVSPIVQALDPATGTFEFTRRNPAIYGTGLTYRYEYSTNLAAGNWFSFIPATNPPVSDGGDPVERVTIGVPNLLLGEPRLFVRVLVE